MLLWLYQQEKKESIENEIMRSYSSFEGSFLKDITWFQYMASFEQSITSKPSSTSELWSETEGSALARSS